MKCLELLKALFQRTGHVRDEMKSRAKTVLTDENHLAVNLTVVGKLAEI